MHWVDSGKSIKSYVRVQSIFLGIKIKEGYVMKIPNARKLELCDKGPPQGVGGWGPWLPPQLSGNHS